MKYKSFLALQLCLLALTVTGCGSSGGSTAYYDSNSYDSAYQVESAAGSGFDFTMDTYESDYEYEENDYEYEEGEINSETEKLGVNEEEVVDSENVEDVNADLLNEKLVYTCNIDIETKEYNKSHSELKDLISKYKGIIQSEQESDDEYGWYYADHVKNDGSRTLNVTCRIPSKHYHEFISGLESLGEDTKIVNKSASVENVTQQYHDNTIKIETLKIQEERLMSMLEQATDVQDMLSIEDRLIRVQTELNMLTNTLLKMDMDVAYSYVYIELEEVMEYTEKEDRSTFFSRMWNEFKDVCDFTLELFESVLSFIMYAIPVTLLVLIPLFYLFRFLLRKAMFSYSNYKATQTARPKVQIYRKTKAEESKQSEEVKADIDTEVEVMETEIPVESETKPTEDKN